MARVLRDSKGHFAGSTKGWGRGSGRPAVSKSKPQAHKQWKASLSKSQRAYYKSTVRKGALIGGAASLITGPGAVVGLAGGALGGRVYAKSRINSYNVQRATIARSRGGIQRRKV